MTAHNSLKQIFVPITKIDAAKRLVYGSATAEAVDKANEICDYATTKPFYEKWSAEISKATDGKSLGNLRVMHGNIAAGKLTSIGFDDTAKRIDICAKVVDDAEWKKVEEGVYTGFSQGGKYVKTWKDPAAPEFTRYTADPIEISLVDLPCLPESTFEMIKADGSTEMRKFTSVAAEPVVSNGAVAERATELAKAAGKPDQWATFLDAARAELTKAKVAVAAVVEPDKPTNFDAEVEQVWKSIDGKTYPKKADALKANADHRAAEAAKSAGGPALAMVAEIAAVLDKREGKEPAKEPVAKTETDNGFKGRWRLAAMKALTPELAKAAAADDDLVKMVAKGMYSVAELASLIASLNWIVKETRWEAESEGDTSTVPGQLKTACDALCQILMSMVAEETAELVAGKALMVASPDLIEKASEQLPHGHLDALMKMAEAGQVAPAAKEAIEKAGARHSKVDKARIDAAHDLLVDAGAKCAPAAKAQDAGDLAKITAERDAMTKAFGDLQPMLKDILDRVKVIEAQPAQGVVSTLRVVGKGDDVEAAAARVASMSPDDLAMLAFKVAQTQGRPLSQRGQ